MRVFLLTEMRVEKDSMPVWDIKGQRGDTSSGQTFKEHALFDLGQVPKVIIEVRNMYGQRFEVLVESAPSKRADRSARPSASGEFFREIDEDVCKGSHFESLV